MTERTLVLIKPDAVAAGWSATCSRGSSTKGWPSRPWSCGSMDAELADRHYAEHLDEGVLPAAERVHDQRPAGGDDPRRRPGDRGGPRRWSARPTGARPRPGPSGAICHCPTGRTWCTPPDSVASAKRELATLVPRARLTCAGRDFVDECPELAEIATEWIAERHILMLGTLRPDGSPRISALECDIVGDDLCSGMIWQLGQGPGPGAGPPADRAQPAAGVCPTRRVTSSCTGRRCPSRAEQKREYEQALHARIEWSPAEPYHCFASTWPRPALSGSATTGGTCGLAGRFGPLQQDLPARDPGRAA